MNIDKDQILQLLRSQGDHDKAQQADQELPQQVDTDQHGDLLSKFGLDIPTLLAKFAGGGQGGQGGGQGDAGAGQRSQDGVGHGSPSRSL